MPFLSNNPLAIEDVSQKKRGDVNFCPFAKKEALDLRLACSKQRAPGFQKARSEISPSQDISLIRFSRVDVMV